MVIATTTLSFIYFYLSSIKYVFNLIVSVLVPCAHVLLRSLPTLSSSLPKLYLFQLLHGLYPCPPMSARNTPPPHRLFHQAACCSFVPYHSIPDFNLPSQHQLWPSSVYCKPKLPDLSLIYSALCLPIHPSSSPSSWARCVPIFSHLIITS